MAKSNNQKAKILYIKKVLEERTDETHLISMPELIKELEENGIKAERKSVYDDIETLRQYGMDIVCKKEKPFGYYLASRGFQFEELFWMVEKIRNENKDSSIEKEQLSEKICGLTSIYHAEKLKEGNANSEKIARAIAENKKISFKYYDWTPEKEKVFKRGGERFVVSPYMLRAEDQDWIVIAYDEKRTFIKKFQLKRMMEVTVEKDDRTGLEEYEEYLENSKENQKICIIFDNKKAGAVIEKFGLNANMVKYDEKSFLLEINHKADKKLFGLLTAFGTSARIFAPKTAAKAYTKYLKEIINKY